MLALENAHHRVVGDEIKWLAPKLSKVRCRSNNVQ